MFDIGGILLRQFKQKLIRNRCLKKFVCFNKYTVRAVKVSTYEEMKKLCWTCVNEIAKKNDNDRKSVSLDYIYRV